MVIICTPVRPLICIFWPKNGLSLNTNFPISILGFSFFGSWISTKVYWYFLFDLLNWFALIWFSLLGFSFDYSLSNLKILFAILLLLIFVSKSGVVCRNLTVYSLLFFHLHQEPSSILIGSCINLGLKVKLLFGGNFDFLWLVVWRHWKIIHLFLELHQLTLQFVDLILFGFDIYFPDLMFIDGGFVADVGERWFFVFILLWYVSMFVFVAFALGKGRMSCHF